VRGLLLDSVTRTQLLAQQVEKHRCDQVHRGFLTGLTPDLQRWLRHTRIVMPELWGDSRAITSRFNEQWHHKK